MDSGLWTNRCFQIWVPLIALASTSCQEFIDRMCQYRSIFWFLCNIVRIGGRGVQCLRLGSAPNARVESQTRMTRICFPVKAATISSEAPASGTSTSPQSMGQIKADVTTESLLEAATTITCFAWL